MCCFSAHALPTLLFPQNVFLHLYNVDSLKYILSNEHDTAQYNSGGCAVVLYVRFIIDTMHIILEMLDYCKHGYNNSNNYSSLKAFICAVRTYLYVKYVCIQYNKCVYTHPYSTNIVEEVDTITNKSDSTPTSETIKVNDLSLYNYRQAFLCHDMHFRSESACATHWSCVKECTHN